MMITRGKGGGGKQKRVNGELRDLTWSGEHTIHYTDDVLQNCTPETYVILLTNVTPINSTKIKKEKKNILSKMEDRKKKKQECITP